MSELKKRSYARGKQSRQSGKWMRRTVAATILLMSCTMMWGCSSSDGTDAADESPSPRESESVLDVDLTSIAPREVVFRAGRDIFVSGAQGRPTRPICTAQIDPAVALVSVSGETLYYIGVETTGPVLWSVDLGSSEQAFLCEGAIDICGATDDRVAFLSESGPAPPELQTYEAGTGALMTHAGSVTEAACDPDVQLLGYTAPLDPGSESPRHGVYFRSPGEAGPRLVREVESGTAAVHAVSSERMLFSTLREGSDLTGDLYSYEIGDGSLHMLASDVRYLDSSDDLSSVVVSVLAGPSDSVAIQAAHLKRQATGEWDLENIGEPVRNGTIGARVAGGGAALVYEATLGRADVLRVFDLATGDVTHETALETGTAIGWCSMSPDAGCIFVTTQKNPPGSTQGIGEETLLAIDTADGSKTRLATSRIDLGGPSLAIVGLSERTSSE